MSRSIPVDVRRAIAAVVERHPGLDLLVLHGSRARDDGHESSDWDFGFIARSPVVIDGLLADLSRALGSDRIDLADLDRASGLLRYRAARDGIAVFERRKEAFAGFWLEAVRFWCEAGPVLERGYAEVLTRLDG